MWPREASVSHRREALANRLKIAVEEIEAVFERHGSSLSPRTYEVMREYFLSEADWATMKELGRKLSVTRERIAQLRDRGVETLQRRIAEERIPEDPKDIPTELFFSPARAKMAQVHPQLHRILGCLRNKYAQHGVVVDGRLILPTMRWFIEEVRESELQNIPNLGRKSISDIRSMLRTEGWILKW